jgi:hypothetical protein
VDDVAGMRDGDGGDRLGDEVGGVERRQRAAAQPVLEAPPWSSSMTR